jgi:hypothetical protein
MAKQEAILNNESDDDFEVIGKKKLTKKEKRKNQKKSKALGKQEDVLEGFTLADALNLKQK